MLALPRSTSFPLSASSRRDGLALPSTLAEVALQASPLYSPLGSRPSTAERSAALRADPKMRELQHFLRSKGHQDRLVASADMRSHERNDRPNSATRAMRILREVEANEDHDPTYIRSTDLVVPRLEWRLSIDRSLRRLICDTELALRGPVQQAHRLRCDHLDKTYAWFEQHGTKEVRKEKVPPPYLRYDVKDRAMPGSLRVAPIRPPVLLGCTSRVIDDNWPAKAEKVEEVELADIATSSAPVRQISPALVEEAPPLPPATTLPLVTEPTISSPELRLQRMRFSFGHAKTLSRIASVDSAIADAGRRTPTLRSKTTTGLRTGSTGLRTGRALCSELVTMGLCKMQTSVHRTE
jgi:hypothetical protein